jgi:hypothetical protein
MVSPQYASPQKRPKAPCTAWATELRAERFILAYQMSAVT